ncbi:site-specific integrase [Alistipes sp.]|uniref:site-specific integrase n=1 Tax=Alistipes sp. TaxID=1872444 RepID=UPI0025BD2132|nr:site-specific integrase [Alistipes sp.]
MSKSTFRILFYVRKNQVNKEGKASIMIRLTINGNTSQFSSKLEVEPELWDVKGQKMSGSSLKARQFNSLLDDVRTSLKNHFHDIETHEAYVTAEKVRNAFLGITIRQQTLLGTFRKHNEDVQKLVGISKSVATYAKYDRCMRRLEEFMQAKYRIKDIALKEISHVFITDFETYLRTESGCNENTTAKFMQTFRMIIIMAKNNGWIFADPFINYKIRLKRVDRGYLTEPEITKILKKQFTCKRLEQVCDVFIFACFTGLAYIDVRNLTKENIQTSFDGKLWIMTARQKTDTAVTVPLLKVPQAILKKYEGTQPDGRLLPVLSNQKLNSYLKEIGDLCGITKNITFHVARHTFATTMTLAKGVPIETVSKMLGHTNIITTQIYARITNDKIGRDMQVLSGQLGEIEKIALEAQL